MIGHDVWVLRGIPWRRTHGALFPWLPPHAQPPLTDAEARRILAAGHAHFVRWEEQFGQEGGAEWWHVIKDRPSSLEELPKKVRYLVRQGNGAFRLGHCSRAEILEEGYQVYRSAYERYRTFERCYDPVRFAKAIQAMPEQVEFWCARARSTGEMVAFAENVVQSDACFYSTMWFSPGALKLGAAYALIHEMNQHYLVDRGLRYVSDGARNISHQTNIHEFLQSKFGFRRAFCRLRVVYSRPVGMVVQAAYPFRRMLRLVPGLGPLDALLEQERIRRACAAST